MRFQIGNPDPIMLGLCRDRNTGIWILTWSPETCCLVFFLGLTPLWISVLSLECVLAYLVASRYSITCHTLHRISARVVLENKRSFQSWPVLASFCSYLGSEQRSKLRSWNVHRWFILEVRVIVYICKGCKEVIVGNRVAMLWPPIVGGDITSALV